MLSCREVTLYADRLLDGELTLLERLRLRLHLGICDHCRRYIRQIRILVGALRDRGTRVPAEVAAAVMRAIRSRSS